MFSDFALNSGKNKKFFFVSENFGKSWNNLLFFSRNFFFFENFNSIFFCENFLKNFLNFFFTKFFGFETILG